MLPFPFSARVSFDAQVDPSHIYLWQAWGVLEWRQGNIEEARRLFQQGIWADPKSKDVCTVFQVTNSFCTAQCRGFGLPILLRTRCLSPALALHMFPAVPCDRLGAALNGKTATSVWLVASSSAQ